MLPLHQDWWPIHSCVSYPSWTSITERVPHAFGQAFGDHSKIAKALAPGGKGKVFCHDCGKPILLRDVIEDKSDQELALGRLLAATNLRRHAGHPHVGWRNPLDGRERLGKDCEPWRKPWIARLAGRP